MVTRVEHQIGSWARPTLADRWRIRSAPVGAEITRPTLVASPPDVDVPQFPTDGLGFLDSARMSRELAREMPIPRNQKSRTSILTALLEMSTQRLLVLGAGVLMLAVGLLALRFPVFLSAFDQWGFQINCGSGFQSSLTQAGIADSAGTHFVDQCHTAVAVRRAWTVPMTAVGGLLLTALLVVPDRQRSASVSG
jgi:hypothetical protein